MKARCARCRSSTSPVRRSRPAELAGATSRSRSRSGPTATPLPARRLFDARLEPALRTDDDLANLAYFGHAAAVVVPALRTPARTASDVLRAFDRLVDRDAPRVAEAGIEPRIALGLLADVAPARTHLEVYDRIGMEANAGRLAAIGPITFSNLAVASPQVEVAAATGLPLLVRTSRAGRLGVDAVLEQASALGVSPASIVFDGCGYTEARAVLDGGAWASLDLSPDGLGNGAVDLVCRYGNLLQERAMFSAGGGTSVDVLAFARAAERLTEARQRGAGVLFANPLRVFGAEGGFTRSR